MARRLVLLRHGRTAWNAVGRVQGQIDVDLDDTGRAQAAAVAPWMADLAPDLLWCSDLARTRQTAALVAAACRLAPSYDAGLRELSLGEWEGRTREELQRTDPLDYARFRSGHYDVVPGAESADQVGRRMAAVLGRLAGILDADGVGLAVSHGGAIRIAVGVLLGWPPDGFRSLRGLHNCAWAELVERVGSGAEEPGWSLEAYHRTATEGAPSGIVASQAPE